MGRRSRNKDKEANSPATKAEPAYRNPDQLTVAQICDLIAELSESILENPQGAFGSSAGPSKMSQLLSLTQHKDEYVAKLAVVSLLALFKDILPAYRIRLPTEQESAVLVSKETKQTWEYERNLLSHYQQYLQVLEKKWNQSTQSPPSSLQVTCMLSLCELLSTAYTFNFRSNLLAAVVRHMNTGISSVVAEACCKAVETVFREDAQGQVAEEAARMVAKVIQNAPIVRPRVVRSFAALPLKVHADEATAAKLLQQSRKRHKKKDKETAAIEAELKESEATVDKAVLARSQAQTLEVVILAYFRILKSCANSSARKSTRDDILCAALEGLAKFAHLINMETVMDLLAVLKDLLREVDTLPLDASLNCILTAFQTLQGPGKELKIDLKEYILPLYTQLPRLCFFHDTDEEGSQNVLDLTLKCLDTALCKRREFSAARVAAFFKQITSVALHLPPASSIPLIAFARNLLQRYTAIQPLLENDEDFVIAAGEYDPLALDPENSNPFSTSAWELALLKFHFRQDVSHQALAAATLKMLQLPAEGPERLKAEKYYDQANLVIEFARVKKKHPLGQSNSKKGRANARFITPRSKRARLVTGDL
ncbi:nucleolar complex protein 3 [Fistulifera solaris]|uniref:Nucleolar complex protein 3 n=1 Tax=Fistulifera solaris TaxID=1519565 RepID=A0A1Z5KAN3_FISSO|nr:nucleolar complex protein 3 [Fistulifera solaris]|eukprot:GAX23215.1 nucleolar complex protein 3 [Fistulifera solaris]